ncbi:605_t:CDS:2 [Dentiscutata erythropus]|uniref:605_t:CDS:1 n=1 Tax=Dentiscutata erythropus TaxID=1348616 RepID=A0A9N9NM09_9GLOM|nr:605_t:CDS:2 [Dentiscutata erythropus]
MSLIIENSPFPKTLDNNTTFSSKKSKQYYAMIRVVPDPDIYVREEKEQRSKSILSLLGIIGGIWSFISAFYEYLFGLGLISPWGIVQKSRLFKKKLLPVAADLQSDEPDIEDKSITKEYEISSIKKRLDNLENVIDISLLS